MEWWSGVSEGWRVGGLGGGRVGGLEGCLRPWHPPFSAGTTDNFLDEFPFDRIEPNGWYASANCGVFA